MIAGHTVVTRSLDGTVGVQHFGPSHEVKGSEIVVDVPVGMTVILRHFHNTSEVSDTPDE